MIRKLKIINFQAYNGALLTLSNGVNSVIGRSDSGKTAIIRAIKWALFNRPAGTSFFPIGEKKSETKTIVTNNKGDQIIRERSKTKNTYTINKIKYDKFGSSPPEQVKDVINIDEWLNVQSQMDSPFLISLSGGEAARLLNSIIKLDDIDRALKNINATHKKEKNEIEFIEKEIEECKEEISKLNWVPKAEADVKILEMKEQELKNTKQRKEKIEYLIKEINITKNKIKQTRVTPQSKIEEIENKLNSVKQKKETYQEIKSLIDNIIKTKDKILLTKEELKEIESNFRKIVPKTCPTCGQNVKKWSIK